MQAKALPCIFVLNVLCSFRKDVEDFRPMERCFACKFYLKFVRDLEEEEEKFFEEVEEREKHGVR